MVLSSGGTLHRTYGYNNVNNVTGISDTQAGVGDTFSFDSLDRLTLEQRSGGNISYSYDANGNRLSKTAGSSIAYTVAANSNRLLQVGGGAPYQYLPTGQISHDGVRAYSYNDEGRLSAVSAGSGSQTNAYNGLGQRVRKTSGQSVYFIYDEDGQLLGEYTGSGAPIREYIWLGRQLVGLISSQVPGAVLQVHTDHLGSPRAISNGATVLWRWEGDAFGGAAANEDVDGDGNSVVMPVRFPGQYHDAEMGLHYNYFRDYDPGTGRYIQSDPIGLKGGPNTYVYVASSPTHYIDPDGRNPVAGTLIGGAIGGPPGAVVGAAIGAGIGALIGSALAGAANGDSADEDSRSIPMPKKPNCGCTCICRADANLNDPRNIAAFAFGSATEHNCAAAAKVAKRNATRALGQQPKHVGCRCNGK